MPSTNFLINLLFAWIIRTLHFCMFYANCCIYYSCLRLLFYRFSEYFWIYFFLLNIRNNKKIHSSTLHYLKQKHYWHYSPSRKFPFAVVLIFDHREISDYTCWPHDSCNWTKNGTNAIHALSCTFSNNFPVRYTLQWKIQRRTRFNLTCTYILNVCHTHKAML